MDKLNLILVLFLITPATSFADNANNVPWDKYLNSLETYSNDNKAPSNERVITSKPNSVNSQDIRKQMEENHKNQLLNIKNLFNEKTGPQKSLSNHITKQESKAHLADYHVVQKTRFNWNGKDSSHKYADYEITIDPTSEINTKELMNFMSKMSSDGWEIDLNKSTQKHNGNTTISITQIRFRKKTLSN